MQKQIMYTRWIQVSTDCGEECIEFDQVFCDPQARTTKPTAADVGDYIKGDNVEDISIIDGYGARLSMPGFMDCTDWVVFGTENEARKYLVETYED